MKSRTQQYCGSGYKKMRSRIIGTPSSNLQKQVWIEKADKHLGLVLKLSPLIPALGGLLLLWYLHLIQMPNLFMSAIGSPSGLIAISLVGVFLSILFAAIFFFPVFLAKQVLAEHFQKYPNSAVSFPAIPILFLPLLLVVAPASYFKWEENVASTLIIATILFGSFIVLYPRKHGVRVGWREWAEIIPRIVLLMLAVLLTSLPLLAINSSLGVDSSWLKQFSIDALYLLVAGFFSFLLSKFKDWKAVVAVFAMTVLIMFIYFHEQVLNGAARTLGIRDDAVKWYWVSKESVAKLLPKEMSLVKRADDYYASARSPFMLGDTRVLCTCTSFVPTKGNKPEICNANENNADACVALEKSEVRSIDSQHFAIKGVVSIGCVTPQCGITNSRKN